MTTTLPSLPEPMGLATIIQAVNDGDGGGRASCRPLPLRNLTAYMLATCRRMALGDRLDAADYQFVAALLARARLRLGHSADSGALQAACVAITTTYLWFWRALCALERAAPAIAGLLTTLPTPRAALRAAHALSVQCGAREPQEEEAEVTISGVAMARHAIARLASACRVCGLLPPQARWSPHDPRPYWLVLYPQDRRGRAAVLLRGERVVMGVAFGSADAGTAHIKFTRPRLLPVGIANVRPRDTAAWFVVMVDRMVAAAGACPTTTDHHPLSAAPVPGMSVTAAGAFDVPRGVSAALLAGDRPDAALAIARFDDVCLAAWLRGRPHGSVPPTFGSVLVEDDANAYASDDEDGSCESAAMAIDPEP
ncbi:hypothetical protein pqer_cds_93 [Pandoravirus quercus]|uniref:DUF5848 domain-containing protein n=1 Tax=Pandoravirus quercus TaxID=2107709 RepID=A0A2U7U7X0_9VIRU|nr:hypothetical protein pqer_cds_93 [Pandoravirus quercus]AVK74515.1 hypothetical protein pqer_cds_93 [Pandoravirus quercus]